MDWFQILVIILSVFLAIFLVLGIVLTALIIKLTKQIKSIADNAGTAVRNVAKTATNVSHATDPVYASRFVSKFISKLKNQ